MARDHDNKEVSHFHNICRKIRFITCDEKKTAFVPCCWSWQIPVANPILTKLRL